MTDEERALELLVELHAGLERLGPGDRASTLRALALCDGLPERPDILDVGCGSGASSLVLAEATGGRVTAVDLFQPFLDDLEERARAADSAHRIRPVQGDMSALPFAPSSFDLVWSEGAVYVMGFDQGLAAWRPLLRPGGFLAVSELSWFTDAPPASLRAHWRAEYPAMRSVSDNVRAAEALGYELLGWFALPDSAWTESYYGPLRARLPDFRAAHAGDEAAAAVAAGTEAEIALFEQSSEHCGYAFFVLRSRSDSTR